MPTVSTDTCDDLVLAADPFVANRYHFGMLLGVDDLDTDQSYHRGKAWLHAAWLHGAGTVWGLEVLLDVEGEDDDHHVREVRVLPGLAIDHRGRELSLPTAQCLDPVAWAQEQGDGLTFEDGEDDIRSFTAHVVVCFDPCRTRPVPSIADPCTVGTDDADTAYSRVRERARVELRPGPAPSPVDRFPRLAALMGIEPPGDGGDGGDDGEGGDLTAEEEAAARAEAQLAALDERVDAMTELSDAARCAKKVRGRAAIDAMSRRPDDGAAPYPVTDPDSCVLLAELTIVLTDADEPRALPPAEDGDDLGSVVDNTVRPAHVDTTTVLGLLACPPSG